MSARRVPSKNTGIGYVGLAGFAQNQGLIYFGSRPSGDSQIWKMPAEGDAAVQATNKHGVDEASCGGFQYGLTHPRGRPSGVPRAPG
jgi:hypothetical protein